MKFPEEMIYEGNLILVNGEYPLRNEYRGRCIPADDEYEDVNVCPILVSAYRNTLSAIHAGNRIVPVSGFRSHKEQTDLFETSLRENGEEFTYQYVALPGHSEHETGLALDVGIRSDHIDYIRPDFPYTGISQVFRTTAPYFGLIERYGRNKESITGISHEPWHFRYVGYPHASFITEQCLCLEEYIALLHKHPQTNPLYMDNHTVFFVPYGTEIHLMEHMSYDVSGNNIDGLIITEQGIL